MSITKHHGFNPSMLKYRMKGTLIIVFLDQYFNPSEMWWIAENLIRFKKSAARMHFLVNIEKNFFENRSQAKKNNHEKKLKRHLKYVFYFFHLKYCNQCILLSTAYSCGEEPCGHVGPCQPRSHIDPRLDNIEIQMCLCSIYRIAKLINFLIHTINTFLSFSWSLTGKGVLSLSRVENSSFFSKFIKLQKRYYYYLRFSIVKRFPRWYSLWRWTWGILWQIQSQYQTRKN